MEETNEIPFEPRHKREHVVFVYKTDASPATDLCRLSELLKNNPGIESWNFDFDDCDNIFRLVSTGMASDEIIAILAFCQIEATELL